MGYLMDETDRIFWDRVHSSMAMDDEEEIDLVRGKPRPSGRERIARTAAPSYNGVAADNQGSLRQGMLEVTPVEIRVSECGDQFEECRFKQRNKSNGSLC